MADGTEEEGNAKGGKLKLVIFAVVGLLVLGGGGGAAAWFMGMFSGGSEGAPADVSAEGHPTAHGEEADGHAGQADDGHGDAKTAEHGAEGGEGAAVAFVDLPDILVNLQSDGQRMRFLKMRVSLETASDAVAERVSALAPRIMDSFQMYLRALTVDDVKGSVGMQQLKEELIARINHAVEPNRVDDMLIKEMLVQ
ncbi:MAG: flagellar basal body-associated FliL family protein [Geminicoccaceae bacterium]|nr:flagellar basal body-associated FliL family protein [Geminicoccaceae bacterium]